jgi:hypothetical protein
MLGLAGAFGMAAGAQQIPDLKVGDYSVQFHAFGSQGFDYSNENNYLTMKTSDGSGAMTDFAVNASMQFSDKLRIGAQMYDYNLGQLGNWHPTLDWAFVDYKFKDWFGVRAGRVKTALGLYNDTQDTNFLYTWALMPQSIYPMDLRAETIAHLGGDIYGHVSMKKLGSVDYTGYYGYVPFDTYGGHYYSTISSGSPETNERQITGGADFRWNTPIAGLLAGVSENISNQSGYGVASTPYGTFPYNFNINGMRQTAFYGDYAKARWHFSGEYRGIYELVHSGAAPSNFGSKAFFAGAAYRISKRLELGEYTSRLYLDQSSDPSNPNTNHIYDQAVTARVDLTNFWNVKIEGHFMNGYGDTYSARGFYLADNPGGLRPDTNLLVIRTGVNF